MAGIQLSGLSSGLDTGSIISQLMAIEKLPRTQLTDRQTKTQARHDALADIQSQLNSLKFAASSLSSAATWADSQSVESSDTAYATVRRTAGAATGGYELTVSALASADQHAYTYAAPGANTTLTVNGATVNLAAGATIDDAVAAINGSDTAGVYAVNVQGKLVLSSKATGVSSAFTATGGPLTEDVASAKPGTDASYAIDGVTHTSASNVVANAIPGVEVTLKAKTTAPVTVTVGSPGPDQDYIVSQVKAFVTAYNKTIDNIRSRTTEQPVKDAANNVDLAKGVLFGDTGLTDILSTMRTTLSQVSSLGISTGAASATVNQDSVQGKLTFDEAAFRTALAANPSSAKASLSSLDTNLEANLNPYVQAGGIMDARVESANSTLRDLADSLLNFDNRMTQRQNLLQQQFTALETALNQSKAAQSSFTAMLG